ncbi:MAG: YiiX family permuted papain-like enzyme [Flavobacteriales bacterium]
MRSSRLNLTLIGIAFLISCSGDDNPTATVSTIITTDLQDGDIIFQTSKSAQSKAIQLATGSKYSHVGIIYLKNNNTFVYEAVQPVKLTPLKDWIKRGEGSHYVVKRLKDAETILTPEVRSKMGSFGESFKGKPYDIYFEWSDDRIYCSELVWKIYHEAAGVDIGELEKLSSFNLDEPAVKQKLKERYGNDIPMDEQVISPASMFESDLLVTVVER